MQKGYTTKKYRNKETFDPHLRLSAAVVSQAFGEFKTVCQQFAIATDKAEKQECTTRLDDIRAELIDDHNPYVFYLQNTGHELEDEKITNTLNNICEKYDVKRHTKRRKNRDRRTS